MNKTKIEYVDFTWNPLVGCTQGCPYCFARRLATTRLVHLCKQCGEFVPHLHEERLDQPYSVRKPALIFADSMSDWWSPGVKMKWRSLAIQAMRDANAHRFVVLTKRPDLIHPMTGVGWPDNAWLGVSITSGLDWWRWEALAKLPGHIHKFISVEPLLPTDDDPLVDHSVGGRLEYGKDGVPEWVIVGPLSGPGKLQTCALCQDSIRLVCKGRNIPLFEKPGLPIQPPIRQMPPELKAVYRKGGLND